MGDTVETRIQHNEAGPDQRFFSRAAGKMEVDRRITAVAIRAAAPAAADISMEADRGPGTLQRINRAIQELQAALVELQPLLTPSVVPPRGEEYLSIKELIARVPYEEQTIRNLICQGELQEGVHYLQRKKHGRIVFVWSRMQEWLRHQVPPSPRADDVAAVDPFYRVRHGHTR